MIVEKAYKQKVKFKFFSKIKQHRQEKFLMHRIEVHELLNIGLKRAVNEDSIFYDISGKSAVFALADGMGGALGGADASRMAIQVFSGFWKNEILKVANRRHSTDRLLMLMKLGFEKANGEIYKFNKKYGRKMGTTFTVVLLTENKAYVMHIGDTRVYFLNAFQLRQITNDDTKVFYDLKEGFISKSFYESHSNDNRLVKCLGITPNVFPQFYVEPMLGIKKVFMCSDGVYQYFDGAHLSKLFLPSVRTASQEILRQIESTVLSKGASDNFSAFLIDIDKKVDYV